MYLIERGPYSPFFYVNSLKQMKGTALALTKGYLEVTCIASCPGAGVGGEGFQVKTHFRQVEDFSALVWV